MLFLILRQLRGSSGVAVLMAVLICLSIFITAGVGVAVRALVEATAEPEVSFIGGEMGVVKSGVEPRVTALGLGVGCIWEWNVFEPGEAITALPPGTAVSSMTLSLPGMITGYGQTKLGEDAMVESAYRNNRLYGRSLSPTAPPLFLKEGRLLGPEDEGSLVGLISSGHFLVRQCGLTVGSHVTCLVPRVTPGRGGRDVIGIPVEGVGAAYLDYSEPMEADIRIVGIVNEPFLDQFIIVPLSGLQAASHAGRLVNLLGLSTKGAQADATGANGTKAQSLGHGFYSFSPGFINAPLTLQLESLRQQGRLLMAVLALLSAATLAAVAMLDLSQRRREHSLLNALGLRKGQLALASLTRFAGVVLVGAILAVAGVAAAAFATKHPSQVLRDVLLVGWPIVAFVLVAAVFSMLTAPREPLEGCSNE